MKCTTKLKVVIANVKVPYFFENFGNFVHNSFWCDNNMSITLMFGMITQNVNKIFFVFFKSAKIND